VRQFDSYRARNPRHTVETTDRRRNFFCASSTPLAQKDLQENPRTPLDSERRRKSPARQTLNLRTIDP